LASASIASAMIYRIARLSPLWLEIQAPLDFASRPEVKAMWLRLAGSDLSAEG
jgi:cobalt-zinc-cadmium efflux system membrane fusion protein